MRLLSKAPLRLSFGGDATDVPPYADEPGGAVLSASINKYVYTTLQTVEKGGLEDVSSFTSKFNLEEGVRIYKARELVEATVEHFGAKGDNIRLLLHSDAPAGSGFGATSTTVVSVAGLMSEWKNAPLTDYDLAKVAYDIERVKVGVPGGRQDHYMATFGGFNFIEFGKGRDIVNRLKIPQDTVNELEYRSLLCYTGLIGRNMEILKDQAKQQDGSKAVLDELKENAKELKNNLLRGNLDDFGQLLGRTWEIKKGLSSKITNPAIDKMYGEALRTGATGGRVLGTGGGGVLLLYCKFDKKHLVAKKLEEMGGKVMDFNFEFRGLSTWRSTQEAR